MIGGGLVGLAMTVPSFTNAASDDTADIVVAALQDSDTTDDTIAATDETGESVRPEAGTQLREMLQALVDDGTITDAQADAVTEHLVENRPERGDRGDRGDRGGRRAHPGADGEVVAELIGIDAAELRAALRDGSTIAELADANDVDPQTVIDALVAEAQGHLDLAVENGRLTEDEAAAKSEQLTERITARVNGERPVRD